MTPIPSGAPADTAYTIPAPSQPLPETSPPPLCIAGIQYVYALGEDFTQETQAQFARYTTSWDINQYEYNGAKTNWVWSDQYSGIGRINNYGYGDSYMVHIDDANPSRSYPGSWVNGVVPRPGAQIVGTPPNAYLDIRAVYVPATHLADANLNGRHWLSGGLQSSKFTFGYTESTVMLPANNGAWPAAWTFNVPGGGGFDGTGTSATNYWESDTFEKFGNAIGPNAIQQTTNSGRPTAMYVRPTISNLTSQWHTIGQLWVPGLLGNPAYMVYYVDRQPSSFYLEPTGVGDMNMNLNLEIGLASSFVGTTASNESPELKLKSYYTWQTNGLPCSASVSSDVIPLPSPSPSPISPPPVAANVGPKLQAYISPAVTSFNTAKIALPAAPPNGALVLLQGVSNNAICPTGFVTTTWANAFLCSGIVGSNGLASSQQYIIGGAGFDKSAAVYVTGVTSYVVNPDIATGWHNENPVSFTKSQAVTSTGSLSLAFAYNVSTPPIYASAVEYTSNLSFNKIYESDGDATFGQGIALLETNVDPATATNATVSYTGTYSWSGTPSSGGYDLLPVIFTISIK